MTWERGTKQGQKLYIMNVQVEVPLKFLVLNVMGNICIRSSSGITAITALVTCPELFAT